MKFSNVRILNGAKGYSAPILQVLGNVQQLTAAGTGTTSEGGTAPNCGNNSSQRQRC